MRPYDPKVSLKGRERLQVEVSSCEVCGPLCLAACLVRFSV